MSELLVSAMARDGAHFLSSDKSTVHFVCKCGTTHHKSVISICKTSGAFCADCTSKNTSIKRIQNKIATINAQLAKQ